MDALPQNAYMELSRRRDASKGGEQGPGGGGKRPAGLNRYLPEGVAKEFESKRRGDYRGATDEANNCL